MATPHDQPLESGKVFPAEPAATTLVDSPPLDQPATTRSVVKERKPRKLTTRQQAFVHHYADPTKPTFGNARRAYAASHPTSHSVNAHGVEGHRTLNKPNVRLVIEEELRTWGYDKARLEHELARNLQATWDEKQYANHRAAIETLAKLRGDWKERQEVETVSREQKDTLRRLVAEALSTGTSQANVHGTKEIGKPVDNSMGAAEERETPTPPPGVGV